MRWWVARKENDPGKAFGRGGEGNARVSNEEAGWIYPNGYYQISRHVTRKNSSWTSAFVVGSWTEHHIFYSSWSRPESSWTESVFSEN